MAIFLRWIVTAAALAAVCVAAGAALHHLTPLQRPVSWGNPPVLQAAVDLQPGPVVRSPAAAYDQ